jgi:hypothetical protein
MFQRQRALGRERSRTPRLGHPFFESLRSEQIICRAISYQAFIQSAAAAVEDGEPATTWRELGAWVDRKIAATTLGSANL